MDTKSRFDIFDISHPHYDHLGIFKEGDHMVQGYWPMELVLGLDATEIMYYEKNGEDRDEDELQKYRHNPESSKDRIYER